MGSKAGSNQGRWSIRRVRSTTGTSGSALSSAFWSANSVAGQTEILWMYSESNEHEGWNYDTSYRYNIVHLPDQNLIRLKLWAGSTLVLDSGNIIDNSSDSLKGGRLGVFCNSQEKILWSNLNYKFVFSSSLYKFYTLFLDA